MKHAIALLTLLVLSACGGGGSHHPSQPGSQGSSWGFGPVIKGRNYSEGMPASPTIEGAGWSFDFPNYGGVDAVINKSPPTLATSITLHFTVTGGGFLPSDDNSGTPASVGVAFQRRGDSWSGSGQYASYRWYSDARINLAPGEFTLAVPLNADQWHNVQGQKDDAGFAAALASVDNVSVVFGGQFSSHGVYATEPSRFTLLDITIGPGVDTPETP